MSEKQGRNDKERQESLEEEAGRGLLGSALNAFDKAFRKSGFQEFDEGTGRAD